MQATPKVPLRIGLEVHVYLATRSKLFCECPADFLDLPANTNLCPICTGQPGAKPMAPNARALRLAHEIAHALGSTPSARMDFLRKHYFYPDQPVNYQRTSRPVAEGGTLNGARIREMHVEEDPGAYDPATGTLDLNRAGSPLLELVTEPDILSAEQAIAFLDDLRLVLDYLGAWRRAAGIKADVNVSVAGGERAEVKNVNTLRGVEAAIRHEERRQRDALARGERQPRETRGFDEATGTTRRLRTKESFEDYRFLADPDLPAFTLPTRVLADVASHEPPLARRARLAAAAGRAPDELSPLFAERALVDAFEALSARVPPDTAFRFLVRDLRGELDFRGLAFAASRVSVDDLGALLEALQSGRITPHVATRLLREALDSGGLPARIVAEVGARPGEDALVRAVAEAIAENAKAVADFRAGKPAAFHFILGAVNKKLKGRAPPDAARAALSSALAGTPDAP